ncbi:MAG: histidinol-phosphate transaminase [Chloroflexi bacterium]|nr:histidinol-phosphate transaminase [Chloroflexota bacterium]
MPIKPRAALDAIVPYVPGAAPAASADRALKLASNENPFGPSPRAVEAARTALESAERYPDGGSSLLRARLAERHGVAPDQILLGTGSDETFYLLTRAYLEPGRRAVMAAPPYGIHAVAARSMGAEIVLVPLRDHTHDLEAMAAAAVAQGCVFVANPHNPTGTAVRPDDLRAFVERVPSDCMVVVDEAYYEFMDPAIRLTAVDLLDRHPSLVVTRTFSKAYGLAGLRVGYAIASAAVLEPVERIRPPFNVTAISLAAAAAALEDAAHVEMTVRETAVAMSVLVDACDRVELGYVPSQANFLLVEDRDSWPVALLAEGITVRPGATLGVPGWARVSLGRPDDMRRVVGVIERTVRAR